MKMMETNPPSKRILIAHEEKEEKKENQEQEVFNHLMKRVKEVNENENKHTKNISKKVYSEKKLKFKRRTK